MRDSVVSSGVARMLKPFVALMSLVMLLVGCHDRPNTSETELQFWMKEQAALGNHAPTRLSVTAELAGSRSEPTLRFRLVNISTGTVELYKGELPWSDVSENGLELFAISPDGRPLDGISVPSHYGPNLVRIPPGESLEGEYQVSWGFVGDWAQQHETLLLWSWPLPKQLNRPREVATGYVVIPAPTDLMNDEPQSVQ